MNLPNKLTLIRIGMVPLFIACFYIERSWASYAAAFIFILASVTDVADGYIARTQNLITDFGKLMDPIADKFLTASALVMLTANGTISPIATIIIVGREFLISGFRLVSAGSGVVIAASKLGKAKTTTQAIALVMAMLNDIVVKLVGFRADTWMLWISVFFTVLSAVDYIKKNYKVISFK